MRSKKSIEETIRTKLGFTVDPPLRDQLLARAMQEQRQSQQTKAARNGPVIGRMIMRNSIVKPAIAAAVIAVVGLGMLEFLGTGGTSGVVWAEVAQRVEASPGVVWRLRTTGSRDPNDDWPGAYKITWRSAALTRVDRYRDGQIYRTIYQNVDARTMISLAHDAKKYMKEAMSDAQVQRVQADKERWTDPRSLLNLCLTLEHHELGQEAINGVPCEGIEATAPGGFTGRLWVSVETGYPVLVEVEAIDDGNIRPTSTLDQFQWDVDLSPEDVEPEIPADYEPL